MPATVAVPAPKPPKIKRVCSGLYRLGDWTIEATEGEQRRPGYTWVCYNTSIEGGGEVFFGSKASAVTHVERTCAST